MPLIKEYTDSISLNLQQMICTDSCGFSLVPDAALLHVQRLLQRVKK